MLVVTVCNFYHQLMPFVFEKIAELLGICFRRKGREERVWAEYMGKKGGCGHSGKLIFIKSVSMKEDQKQEPSKKQSSEKKLSKEEIQAKIVSAALAHASLASIDLPPMPQEDS